MTMVMFSVPCYAAPFLTCNNVPAGSWDGIGIAMDGAVEVVVVPKTNTDGTITLWYDLASLPNGNHNVILRARKGVQ